jgi:hypothetical protein
MAQHTAKPPADPWPHAAHTQQEVRDGLLHCRELLHQVDEGLQKTLTRVHVMAMMDRWLEELCELKELQWIPDLEVIE